MTKFFLVFVLLSFSLFAQVDSKKVLFLAGHHDLIHNEHEFLAGCHLLAYQLNNSGLAIEASVVESLSTLDDQDFEDIDVLIVYSGGFGQHALNKNFAKVDSWFKGNKSIGFLHTACQVSKGAKSKLMTKWAGGYYRNYFSTDPEWLCSTILNKNNTLTKGVKPFELRDKWLFNIHFEKEGSVQTVLSGTPDELARSGKYTSHRNAIKSIVDAKDKIEKLMWTHETPSGGRSLVFTGGHYYENWRNQNFCKLVLNGIVWLAGIGVPEGGVRYSPMTIEQISANMSKDETAKKWQVERSFLLGAELAFSSKIISDNSPKKSVEIDLSVEGKNEISLVVLDGGDGIGRDHAVWAFPKFLNSSAEVSLTEQEWQQALTGWRSIFINQGLNGEDLKLNGREVSGIATHSISVIRYKIPKGMKRFSTTAGLADSRKGGTLQFQVYVK
jgi:hypothetical protein